MSKRPPAAKKAKEPTKTEIASQLGQKIDAHLKRIESEPTLNPGKRYDKALKKWVLDPRGSHDYYCARARGKGPRVWVIYVSYQRGSYMSIENAARYLAFLDAGHVGPHFTALEGPQA